MVNELSERSTTSHLLLLLHELQSSVLKLNGIVPNWLGGGGVWVRRGELLVLELPLCCFGIRKFQSALQRVDLLAQYFRL